MIHRQGGCIKLGPHETDPQGTYVHVPRPADNSEDAFRPRFGSKRPPPLAQQPPSNLNSPQSSSENGIERSPLCLGPTSGRPFTTPASACDVDMYMTACTSYLPSLRFLNYSCGSGGAIPLAALVSPLLALQARASQYPDEQIASSYCMTEGAEQTFPRPPDRLGGCLVRTTLTSSRPVSLLRPSCAALHCCFPPTAFPARCHGPRSAWLALSTPSTRGSGRFSGGCAVKTCCIVARPTSGVVAHS